MTRCLPAVLILIAMSSGLIAMSSGVVSAQDGNATEGREQRLAGYLSGASFQGSFTVDGAADAVPKSESYQIKSCEKLPEADRYRLTVAIKYGDVDGEFPMDLTILWAGKSPVITLDQLWIPGLGTFSSKVVIDNDRYAGTWQHGEKGGHLFGKISKAK